MLKAFMAQNISFPNVNNREMEFTAAVCNGTNLGSEYQEIDIDEGVEFNEYQKVKVNYAEENIWQTNNDVYYLFPSLSKINVSKNRLKRIKLFTFI